MSAGNAGERLAADLEAGEADATVVVARRAFAIGSPPGPRPEAAPESGLQAQAAPESGPQVHAEVEVDETVVVSRAADETIIVQRTGPAPSIPVDADETVVVARRAAVSGGEREGDGEVADETLAVDRTVVRGTPLPADPRDGVMNAPTRRGRRVAQAPVSDEVLSTAEVGRGPGLLEHYAARPIEVEAPPPRAFADGARATRDPAQTLPSIARRSRRSALVVLAAFASSCVIAAVGLIVVVVLALAG